MKKSKTIKLQNKLISSYQLIFEMGVKMEVKSSFNEGDFTVRLVQINCLRNRLKLSPPK
ncbi:hypothetical protein ACNQGX_00670 [Flavobacterium sp. ZB4P13]